MPIFRIYIDEVGNHDLASATNPNERFLSLTGIIVESEKMKGVIAPELERFKRELFDQDPDEPVIFHRKEILNKKGPFRILTDPSRQKEFDRRLIALLGEWEYQVITVVIDKLAHCEQYRVWNAHPYHYCLKILLERYSMFLRQSSS